MRISALGEFGLIDRLAAVLGPPPRDGLVVGIGDDAAAWRASPSALAVATADSLVEGVHFTRETIGWHDLGWKALAVNLSDVAAMGCQPRYALCALGLPADLAVEATEALYAGVRECATAYACGVVGGDVVRAPCVMIQVTVIGESVHVRDGQHDLPLLVRSGARPGDVLAVSGPLGGSAAGLELLLGNPPEAAGDEPPSYQRVDSAASAAVEAHRRPRPRVVAGQVLVETGLRCAIDVSDGLVADVGHICERSDVDAVIEAHQVPVHPAAAESFPERGLEMALTGGEDYELVCAGPLHLVELASQRLQEGGEPPLTVIGSIQSRSGKKPRVQVHADGGELVLRTRGYEAFENQ